MLKRPLLFMVFIFMIMSWLIGLFSLTKFYTPTIIVPTWNSYIWVTPFLGLLGATVVFTIVTIGIFYSQKKKINFNWKMINGVGTVFWMLVILAQLKVVAYNLGICH